MARPQCQPGAAPIRPGHAVLRSQVCPSPPCGGEGAGEGAAWRGERPSLLPSSYPGRGSTNENYMTLACIGIRPVFSAPRLGKISLGERRADPHPYPGPRSSRGAQGTLTWLLRGYGRQDFVKPPRGTAQYANAAPGPPLQAYRWLPLHLPHHLPQGQGRRCSRRSS